MHNTNNKQHLCNQIIHLSKIIYTFLIIFILFSAPQSIAGENVLQLFEKEFKQVVTSSRPAVVKILANFDISKELANGFGRVTMYRQDISSGIILDDKGHIVTTSFAMKPNKIEIVYNDKKVPAKLIGMDDLTDVAVLKTDVRLKKRTKVGDSTGIDTASLVFTIGSSQGDQPVVSFGIVSGIENLPTHPCANLIKINAPVSVGNSGGAVVNTSGEVVGMILAILSPQDTFSIFSDPFPLPTVNSQTVNSQNPQMITVNPQMITVNSQIITFAVPMETVKSVSSQIIKHGKVPRGWLGVDMVTKDAGVLVTRVIENSPAERSGILPEDIIIQFNQKPVKTYIELLRCVGNSTPNTNVSLNIIRDGNKINYTIKLGERYQRWE